MLYSQTDSDAVIAESKKRRLLVWFPPSVLFLLSIAALVWFRIEHNTNGWIVSALLTIVGGSYLIFFQSVYLRPVLQYKKLVDYMLGNRLRENVGLLQQISEDILDHDGIDCYSVTINVGEKGSPEDDRSFYLDAHKSVPGFSSGDTVRIKSNDRMIASIEKVS